MPAVLVTGPTVMQDSLFFPSSSQSYSQYSLLPTHRGMAQAELTWVPGSVLGWFTHPGTNWARRRVTTLIKSNALPLRITGFELSTSLGNSGLCWTIFARNRDTAVPAEGNGDLQTLICVLVARPRQCLTLSNPVPWQNWMAAYLGYTLRMRTLFRGWPIMVNDTHTRRRRKRRLQ